MTRPRRNRPLLAALYVNAAMLFAILVALLARGNSPGLVSNAYGAALSPQPIAGGANLYLMPAQFSANTWGCYVLDIDSMTLCAYRYFPSGNSEALRLVAARKISYDRKLANFNSDKPSWLEVKQWVDQANQPVRGQDSNDGQSAPKSNTEQNTRDNH